MHIFVVELMEFFCCSASCLSSFSWTLVSPYSKSIFAYILFHTIISCYQNYFLKVLTYDILGIICGWTVELNKSKDLLWEKKKTKKHVYFFFQEKIWNHF